MCGNSCSKFEFGVRRSERECEGVCAGSEGINIFYGCRIQLFCLSYTY